MFNQRNNPFTRGQFSNQQQRPRTESSGHFMPRTESSGHNVPPPPNFGIPQFQPNNNKGLRPGRSLDDPFDTINLNQNNGINTYVRNRRNGNQWEHTTYENQPFLPEVQRQERNDERNYQLQLQTLEQQNNDRQNERTNNYQLALLTNDDRQNQRNHELAMHRIANVNQITNARIAEGDALLQRQFARRQAYINNPKVRHPVKNEQLAAQIKKVADLIEYDIDDSNPRDVFISNEIVEPDLRQNLYSHTIFLAGVEDYDLRDSYLKIIFTDNRIKPITYKCTNGRYYKVIKSTNYPHLMLVRVFIIPATYRDEGIISKICPPCPKCTIL